MKKIHFAAIITALAFSMSHWTASCGVDEASRDGGTDAGGGWSGYCIGGATPTATEGLAPIPRYHWTGPGSATMAQRTISVSGATNLESAEIAAIAANSGLTVTGTGASLEVTIHQKSEWTRVVKTCGLPAVETGGGYYLSIRPDPSGTAGSRARADVFGIDDDGIFHALKTLKQMTGYDWPVFRERAVLDWPGSSIRGVLEGFYGTPWGEDARIKLIGMLSDLKMNFYIYAPKDDPAINIGWRNEFLPEEARYIRKVAEAGRKNRVNICWEIHPGNLITFSSEEDFNILMKKYAVIAAQGVDCLLLAFDDVEKVLNSVDEKKYASFVEAQVDLGNRVGTALHVKYPEALLGFVPTDYWTNAEGTQTDLRYLGAHLSQVWHVAWTGREVVSKTITVADADEIASIIGRPPFLGDNFPVADLPGTSGVLNIGPLVGREPGLPSRTSGFVFNAMPYPYASLPSAATGSDYLWNPQGYDSARSLQAVSQALSGKAGWKEFRDLCDANHDQYLEPTASPELDAAIKAFWSAWDQGSDIKAPASDLGRLMERYQAVPPGLEKAKAAIDADLLSEIAPWAGKLGAYGAAGSKALGLLLIEHGGGTVDPAETAGLKSESEALKALKPKPTGRLMDDFLAKALQVLGG